jgi:hypothetical protein
MAMATPKQGLSSPADVEGLADQLSACADALHARILDELKAAGGAAKAQAMARILFDHELVLRQRAQGLYVDAATLVVKGLGREQQHIAALTAAAAEKIRKIAVIADVAGVVSGLVQLAAAAATGQAAPIVVAIEKLGKKVKSLDAHTLNKPA